MPAVSNKKDFGQKKSLIPRPTFKKISKINRAPNAENLRPVQTLHECKKLPKHSTSRKGENKENEAASTSSNLAKSRSIRNGNKNSKISAVDKPNLLRTKVENINPTVKKTFVNKQIESGLVSFEPDPKALQSILVNKGITSDQFNGRFSSTRPSLYGNSSRFSMKKLTIQEVTLKFAEAVARQASCSTTSDVPNDIQAQTKKTPVRLSMYGRRTSIIKLNKTPSTLLKRQNGVATCRPPTTATKSDATIGNSFVAFPSTANKPSLVVIAEGDLERDSLSPKPTKVEIRRDSGAFNTYAKPAEASAVKKTEHFVHTPKPKRRYGDERKSFADVLNVSPLCNAALLQLEPPIRTPLLMRTVSMRVKHEQNTTERTPFCLRKSSPKFDLETEKNLPNVFSSLISPIKCTKEDSNRDYARFGVVDDEALDRICDAEIENLTENAAKRLKMCRALDEDLFIQRVIEPVAATLTDGDEQCFLPIAEE